MDTMNQPTKTSRGSTHIPFTAAPTSVALAFPQPDVNPVNHRLFVTERGALPSDTNQPEWGGEPG